METQDNPKITNKIPQEVKFKIINDKIISDKRPLPTHNSINEVEAEKNFDEIKQHRSDNRNELIEICNRLLQCLGEDTSREGLVKTPARMADALLFLTRGYETKVADVVNNALFTVDTDDIIIVKDIEISSLCEHHLLPFFGRVHIGYIPDGKVIGLSKLARIAEIYSKRLQVQERLTRQIVNAVMDAIRPTGCGVVIECNHMCMSMRGVQKQHSKTISSAMAGVFRDDEKTRQEFLRLIGYNT